MRPFALSVLVAVTAVMSACNSGGQTQPEPKPKPDPAITQAELVEHLKALQRIADDNGGTRAVGTPGYDASVRYVSGRLRNAGWDVTRQRVPFTFFDLHGASLTIGGRSLTRAKHFQVLTFSGSGRARGRLRAAGDGCSAAAFAGLGRGEIPLVTRFNCFFRVKARNAERAGAPALVVYETVRSLRGVPSGTLAVPGIKIPVVLTSTRVLGDSGDGTRASVAVDASARAGHADNVIAETPGGDGDRIVMAGAHLDSVAGGPGINDNGSGTATLIEAAEAIGPHPPGARVRLAFWAAEELGLLGSRHYVNSLDREEKKAIRAYLNFDMVGSPNPVPGVYTDGDARLAKVLSRAVGTRLGGALAGANSDHTFFQLAGIPINGLYTGSDEAGPGGRARDPCYHLACDRLPNVNRRVLVRMARAAAHALERLSAEQP